MSNRTRRTRARERPAEDEDGWVALYSDLVSLLLGFFILLYSASAIDRIKYAQLSASLGDSMGGGARVAEVMQGAPKSPSKDAMNAVLEKLVEHIEQGDLADSFTLTRTRRGIELTTDSELMFDSAQADLKPNARQFLHAVTEVLRDCPCTIIVEGHTDPLPIRSRIFPSNWELSSARASSVVRYLMEHGVAKERMMAVGRAATQPARRDGRRARGKAERQLDRRVVLVLVPLDNLDPLRSTEGNAPAREVDDGAYHVDDDAGAGASPELP